MRFLCPTAFFADKIQRQAGDIVQQNVFIIGVQLLLQVEKQVAPALKVGGRLRKRVEIFNQLFACAASGCRAKFQKAPLGLIFAVVILRFKAGVNVVIIGRNQPGVEGGEAFIL